MGELWRRLVTANPMNVEVKRSVRKHLSFNHARGSESLALILGILLYALIVILTINFRGDMHPKVLVGIHLVFAVLVAPMTLHASIAGERERRTWDMLMVAPVSHAQIVAGKMMGGLAVQAAVAVALLIPALIALVTFQGNDPLSLWGLIRLTFLNLSVGVFCSALTMLVSARVKRAFVALGVSLTLLFLVFIFFPTIIGTGGGPGSITDLLLAWHPFSPIMNVDQNSMQMSSNGEFRQNDSVINGIWQGLFFLVFSLIFTTWTIKTIGFADNDVRFLPKKKAHETSAETL